MADLLETIEASDGEVREESFVEEDLSLLELGHVEFEDCVFESCALSGMVAERITVPYAPADLFPITEHLLIVGSTSSIALIGYLLLCNLPLFILFVLESHLVGIRFITDWVPFLVIFVNNIITRSGV